MIRRLLACVDRWRDALVNGYRAGRAPAEALVDAGTAVLEARQLLDDHVALYRNAPHLARRAARDPAQLDALEADVVERLLAADLALERNPRRFTTDDDIIDAIDATNHYRAVVAVIRAERAGA